MNPIRKLTEAQAVRSKRMESVEESDRLAPKRWRFWPLSPQVRKMGEKEVGLIEEFGNLNIGNQCEPSTTMWNRPTDFHFISHFRFKPLTQPGTS